MAFLSTNSAYQPSQPNHQPEYVYSLLSRSQLSITIAHATFTHWAEVGWALLLPTQCSPIYSIAFLFPPYHACIRKKDNGVWRKKAGGVTVLTALVFPWSWAAVIAQVDCCTTQSENQSTFLPASTIITSTFLLNWQWRHQHYALLHQEKKWAFCKKHAFQKKKRAFQKTWEATCRGWLLFLSTMSMAAAASIACVERKKACPKEKSSCSEKPVVALQSSRGASLFWPCKYLPWLHPLVVSGEKRHSERKKWVLQKTQGGINIAPTCRGWLLFLSKYLWQQLQQIPVAAAAINCVKRKNVFQKRKKSGISKN